MSRVAVIRLVFIASLVGLLELFCRIGAINHRVIIPPSEMLAALAGLVWSGEATSDIARTLGAVIASLVLAAISGFLIGLAIHALPRLRQALDPFLATYYAVPLFVFYPVLIALFGISLLPITVMGFAFAVVSVIISTLNGLDQVPRVLRKVARVHRLSKAATIMHLIIPAAAPHLFTGVKLAIAYCFIGVIASEFISAPAGIGHAIAYAYSDFNNRTMYGLMLLIVIVVTTVNMLVHHYEQRLNKRIAKRR